MPDHEPQALLALLDQNRAAELIGRLESLAVDFKAAQYVLDLERQKFELARDVSSLANASGGILTL